MELFVILTLQRGGAMTTMARTVTADPGTTRAGMFTWALEQLPPEWRGGAAPTVFFSVEPNALIPAAGDGA